MTNRNQSNNEHHARPIHWTSLSLLMAAALSAALMLGVDASAQQLGVDTTTVMEQPGSETGNYHTNASVELGVQITGVGGSMEYQPLGFLSPAFGRATTARERDNVTPGGDRN